MLCLRGVGSAGLQPGFSPAVRPGEAEASHYRNRSLRYGNPAANTWQSISRIQQMVSSSRTQSP
jgi:hypothetical protein